MNSPFLQKSHPLACLPVSVALIRDAKVIVTTEPGPSLTPTPAPTPSVNPAVVTPTPAPDPATESAKLEDKKDENKYGRITEAVYTFYGEITEESVYFFAINAEAVSAQSRTLDPKHLPPIRINLNSPGGSVFDGMVLRG